MYEGNLKTSESAAAAGSGTVASAVHPCVELMNRAKHPEMGKRPYLLFRDSVAMSQEIILTYSQVYEKARRLAGWLQSDRSMKCIYFR